MRKLVLFDIDGTILWTDGAGRAAITQALIAEMGTAGPIDGFRFDGKTDPQIVIELMTAAGHPHARSEEHVTAVCQRYVTLLERELARRRGSVSVFPGVPQVLDGLDARGDALVGLLTGNVAAGAALKLAAAGLEPARFRVGAYGSDATDRASLPAIAVERARALLGRVARGHEIVIIGDTPADMTCGHAAGARAIGVTTGSYGTEDLYAAGAYAVFDGFVDPEPVIAAIHA